jgi:REP element-mobilizing transposase RayT
MSDESGHFHRRSIRLKGYDYRQAGAYFVTLVTAAHECIFGDVKNDLVVLNNTGCLVSALWQALPSHFSIALGDWVVMPNHLHGIIILQNGDGGGNGDRGGGGRGEASGANILDSQTNGGDGVGRGEASGANILDSKTNSLPDASPLRARSRARSPSVKWEKPENPPGRPNGTESGSLGAIIQNFKSITTRRVNNLRPKAASESLWQRNYHEHIIRSDQEWDVISRYIIANPIRWDEEKNFPPGENDRW